MFNPLPISNMGKVISPSFRARERNNFLNFLLGGWEVRIYYPEPNRDIIQNKH